jgi:hypothetical protein
MKRKIEYGLIEMPRKQKRRLDSPLLDYIHKNEAKITHLEAQMVYIAQTFLEKIEKIMNKIERLENDLKFLSYNNRNMFDNNSIAI